MVRNVNPDVLKQFTKLSQICQKQSKKYLLWNHKNSSELPKSANAIINLVQKTSRIQDKSVICKNRKSESKSKLTKNKEIQMLRDDLKRLLEVNESLQKELKDKII